MGVRRVYFIRTEDNWVTYYPSLKMMRAEFDAMIKDGIEPDTGHVDYMPTREGICALLNSLKQDGD